MARHWTDTAVTILIALAGLMILGQMAMDAYRVSEIRADPEMVIPRVIGKEKSRVLLEKYEREELNPRKHKANPRFNRRP